MPRSGWFGCFFSHFTWILSQTLKISSSEGRIRKQEETAFHPCAFSSKSVLPQAARLLPGPLLGGGSVTQAEETRAHPEVKEEASPTLECWRWDMSLAGQDSVEERRWASAVQAGAVAAHGELQAHLTSRVTSLTCLLHPSLLMVSLVCSCSWLSGEQAWNTAWSFQGSRSWLAKSAHYSWRNYSKYISSLFWVQFCHVKKKHGWCYCLS